MTEWWKDYPWRMIQTNLRQIDMRDINAGRFVEDLLSFDATVVLFNAAGIIANYPTDLDYEPVNEYLTGDSMAKIIEKCHDAGIRIMARTDFSKVREPVYEKHPGWAFRDAEGKIVNYNGDVHVCPNGPYQQEYMFKIITDMFKRLPFDGIFYNMGGFQTKDYSYNYHGICHCQNCERKFKERFGLELPKKEDMNDPVYRKHRVFQEECIRDLNERLAKHVRAIGAGIAMNDHEYQRIESNTEIGRPLPLWQYAAASNTRNSGLRGSGKHPSNTSVDFLGFYYRHVAVSPHLQELRMWQNLANLGGLDYYLIGRLDNHGDKSGYAGIRKVFKFAKENYEELKGLDSDAKVALFHKSHWDDDPEVRGWIRALTENHIPFDEIQLSRLSNTDQIRPYQLAILPDLKFMADDKAAIFDEFANKGGTVLASGETSFWDGSFEKRPGPALKCLGVEEVYYHRKDMLSAMFLVDTPEEKEIFTRYRDTRYIAFGSDLVFTKPNPKAKKWLRMLAPQMYGPPERCYGLNENDQPAFTSFPYGQGLGLYIPWKPGAFLYREGYSNTEWFMWDVLEHICKVKSIAPDLSPMVETTLASRPNRTVIQMVNTSGHFGNSYFAPLALNNVELRIPVSAPVREARTLYRKGRLEYRQTDGFVEISLPFLGEYEAVVLETENNV